MKTPQNSSFFYRPERTENEARPRRLQERTGKENRVSKLNPPINYEELKKRTDSYMKDWKKTAYDGPDTNSGGTDGDTKRLSYFLPDYIKANLTASYGDMYVCPFCGSGTGPDRTGAFGIVPENRTKFKCFACDTTGDIYDLIGQVEGISDFKDQKRRAVELYGGGILTGRENTTIGRPAKREKNEDADPYDGMTWEAYHAAEKALKEYYEECNARLHETLYHRGLSMRTMMKFNVGYDPAWKNPKNPNGPASPRLIIPTGDLSYIARSTDPDIDSKYRVFDVGKKQIFNVSELVTAEDPIFIVEGEIDAMSIDEAGGVAVGLGGVGNYKKLIDYILDIREDRNGVPYPPFIVALDNDDTGRDAARKIAEALAAYNIEYRVVNIYGDQKDANDALNADREALEYNIKNVLDLSRLEYVKEKSVAGYMDAYIDYLEKGQETFPTGFPKLDKRLGGGFPTGLIVLGAVSSAGKTTFLLQVADNMTGAGYDVLYFSLEMSKREIITKSLSRLTYINSQAKYGSDYLAKDTRTIMRAVSDFNESERGHFNEALKEYEKHAPHMFILEGDDGANGELNVDGIRERVERHINATGKRPVVFIDYLQILPPVNPKATDTEAVRYNVKALKDLSRDYDTPVIVISSFNRESYNGAAVMESFKQSGGIEYSADLLLTLDFNGVGNKGFSLDEAKKKYPREIGLRPLKDRNGDINWGDPFYYITQFNYFYEGDYSFEYTPGK